MATWVDLSTLYVKKAGDTVTGALTVSGALTANGVLTANNGLTVKYGNTTYDVGAQLYTIGTNIVKLNNSVSTASKQVGRGTTAPSGTSVATYLYIRTT